MKTIPVGLTTISILALTTMAHANDFLLRNQDPINSPAYRQAGYVNDK